MRCGRISFHLPRWSRQIFPRRRCCSAVQSARSTNGARQRGISSPLVHAGRSSRAGTQTTSLRSTTISTASSSSSSIHLESTRRTLTGAAASSRRRSPQRSPRAAIPWRQCTRPRSASQERSNARSRWAAGTVRSTRCSGSWVDRGLLLKESWGYLRGLSCGVMSKRKRASLGKTSTGADNPAGEAEPTSTDDAAAKEDMAHVSPDLLAGSPDIFAPKWTDPPAAAESQEAVSEPIVTEKPSEPPATPVAKMEPVPAESVPVLAPEASASAPPPPVTYTAQRSRPRGGGSSAALGIVLVVVGLFALGVVLFGVDLTQYGWPLFVIIPGLTLLGVGFLGGGAGASVPGGIVTMLGLVLAYQSSSGDWASWAFAWALIAPGGVGLGLYLQALRDRDPVGLRRGRTLMFVALLIFMIGFVLFESILGISGQDYGVFGKAALPALLIVIGLILLVRSIQRSRAQA